MSDSPDIQLEEVVESLVKESARSDDPLIEQSSPERDRPSMAGRVRFNIGSDSPDVSAKREEKPRPIAFTLGPTTNSDDEEETEHNHLAHPKVKRKPRDREMLVELYDLHADDSKGDLEWQETARWMKYEEDAEGVDYHWGRPHVAFLSFHSLIQLRKCLAKGVLLFDLKAENFEQTCRLITTAMAQKFKIDETRSNAILSTLKRTHRHANEHGGLKFLRQISTQPNLERMLSTTSTSRMEDGNPVERKKSWVQVARDAIGKHRTFSTIETPDAGLRTRSGSRRKQSFLGVSSFANASNVFAPDETESLMRHLPDDAEAVQVFVGVLKELQRARFAMVRLADAVFMPELMDAPIPIRFLFVILGPEFVDVDYHELGRSIATLMSNKHFHEIAYGASTRGDLVSAVDQFLDESVVIPPGEVDSKKLLSVDEIQKALRKRAKSNKVHQKPDTEPGQMDTGSKGSRSVSTASVLSMGDRRDPLARSGRLFGGLVEDLRARVPFYWSDYRDALNFKCITSIVFMFFASAAPAITFGGLLGKYTDDYMGPTETLLAQSLCGVIWGLFSAQPLLIMSATGPVLIFEGSMYGFCTSLGLDFLAVRVWAGVWLVIIALITVMLEGSFLLRYVTRFTEDIFATLISAIFIAESIKFVQKTFEQNPVVFLDYYKDEYAQCTGNISNATLLQAQNLTPDEGPCKQANQPDTALLTAVLLLATFMLAYVFKQLRSSVYFGRQLRQMIGDFGVLISILIVALVDYLIFEHDVYLERIDMPKTFGFTSPDKRDNQTIVNLWFAADKWWGYLFALLPAFLVYILLFVETEITELLLSKKERGMRKGSGFHWDLLLVAVLALVCSLLGLPWMCAAAVQSLAHANSLTVLKVHAPGARPKVDYVIEQRVTTIGVALLVGACAFAGAFLSFLPLAVLMGVFLYLGAMNLTGVQFVRRLVLLFIPEKYFPDEPYCQKVGMKRMHLYTGLQLLCLIVVYLVKNFEEAALAFPFILMLCAVIRQTALPAFFSQPELDALDAHEEHEEDEDEFYDLITIPL